MMLKHIVSTQTGWCLLLKRCGCVIC